MISYLWLLSFFICHGYAKSIGDVPRHRVVVVRAGVSGFTAAATLLEHNVTDIIVLEAADRIGGGIHTVKFGGVPIDKGVEECHGEENNSVYELVNPYNFLESYLPLLTEGKTIFVNSSGDLYGTDAIRNLIDTAMNDVMFGDDLQHFNGSVADFFSPRMDEILRNEKVESELSEALKYRVSQIERVSSACDSLSELGAWGSSLYKDCEGDHYLKWKNGTGGYKTLFDIISKQFPNPTEKLPVVKKTELGKQVTRIERKEGEVEVTCADGSIYLADHVIVTVSLSVYSRNKRLTCFILPCRRTRLQLSRFLLPWNVMLLVTRPGVMVQFSPCCVGQDGFPCTCRPARLSHRCQTAAHSIGRRRGCPYKASKDRNELGKVI